MLMLRMLDNQCVCVLGEQYFPYDKIMTQILYSLSHCGLEAGHGSQTTFVTCVCLSLHEDMSASTVCMICTKLK